MAKKQRKMSIVISDDALMAFRSNAGFFYGAADAAMPAIHQSAAEAMKIHLTKGQVTQILEAIQDITSGPKYGAKLGREYRGLCLLDELLKKEALRQLG